MADGRGTARRKVLEVEDIRTRFHTRDGTVHAVNGISFDLREGELLGVVGESGSGKSVTMMSLLKLLPMPPAEIVSGRALLDGEDLIALDVDELTHVRGARVGFIFQDPMTSLNPVLSVGYQLTEPLRVHLGMKRRRRAAPGGRAAGSGRHSRRGEPPRRLPAPVLGRDAPAGDDRHRARLQPQGADRGRADHRARRHHPGADPRPREAAAGASPAWRSSGSPTTSE